MALIDLLIDEFGHEARTTRPHLERLPNDKLEWRPHRKSFTAGGLGSHIVECLGWAESIFLADEFVFDPVTFVSFAATSVDELLQAFDDRVARGADALSRASDADLARPWRLVMRGRVRVERPKAAVFRDFTLSHLIHHRGQLSVYLRLLDVPVPGSYGPTADEGA
jgi:uncharacterized damage-inducible protein DinB